MQFKDTLRILKLNTSSTPTDAKKSYRKMAKTYHPDNLDTGSELQYKLVVEAFETFNKLYEEDKKRKTNIKQTIVYSHGTHLGSIQPMEYKP